MIHCPWLSQQQTPQDDQSHLMWHGGIMGVSAQVVVTLECIRMTASCLMVCRPDAWGCTCAPGCSTYLKKKKLAASWACLEVPGLSQHPDMYYLPDDALQCCWFLPLHNLPLYIYFYHLCFSVPSLCLDELNNIMHCYYPWYSGWYNNLLHRPLAWKPEVVICSQVHGRLQCQIRGCIQCSYWRISQECISQELSQLVHNKCLYIIHHLISSYITTYKWDRNFYRECKIWK